MKKIDANGITITAKGLLIKWERILWILGILGSFAFHSIMTNNKIDSSNKDIRIELKNEISEIKKTNKECIDEIQHSLKYNRERDKNDSRHVR